MLLRGGRVTPESINVTAAFIRRMMQMQWTKVKVALLAIALGAGGASVAAAVPASAATNPASVRIVPDVSGIMLENAHSVKCLSSDGRDDQDAGSSGWTDTDGNQPWQ